MKKTEIFKKPEENIQVELVFELLEIELRLLKVSHLVHSNIQKEIESVLEFKEVARQKRTEFQTVFENFDQKSNQLFNVLSTVLKSMKEMRTAASRNML